MSYLNLDELKFEEDILNRKEFIENEYNIKNKKLKDTKLDKLIKNNNILILNNYQKFITNFINPNTKYNRLLLIHSTGVGKTITSLSTAINFINIYKKEKIINNTQHQGGMVYIIGFTKSIFKRELFHRSEFGIVTNEEIKELDELKKEILKYNYEKDILKLKELKKKYSSRLKSKKGNGYFEFIGYKELVNKLILKNQYDYHDSEYNIQLQNIKTEKELNYLIEQDIIKINYNFLNQFNKSLLICDEIHNVYNSLNTNNWGLCLNIILNHYKDKNNLKILFLSATPINNKPIELISLLKLLNNNLQITKDDIFDSNENIKKSGYELIKKYIYGKISFLKDMDLESYPNKEFHGNSIENIPYLKFIKCPMTDLHFKTYENLSKSYEKILLDRGTLIDINSNLITSDNENENVDKEEIKKIVDGLKIYPINLELENRYLTDIIFPNPNNKNLGLYLKEDIIKNITNASLEWKKKNDIYLINNDRFMKNTITGNILLENNIKKYSNKYYKTLEIIKNIIINNKGKIFIYHNFVQVSGVNLLSEIFKINGYLSMNDTPTKYSKCNICYKIKNNHDNKNHEFQPIRFITINSFISKHTIDKEIDTFNLSNNINGEEIRIILGSKAIKESYNLKAIQNLIVLHQPDNISTLIQVFGRGIRKNSHINLPQENKKVNIYILVSTIPDYIIKKKNKKYIYSYEEMKYKYKLNIYKTIQKINDIFIEIAIDRNINYNINFPTISTEENNDLYNLNPLNKNKLIKIDYNKINLSTFQSYYYQEEIEYCKYIIKRLFIEFSPVWKYKDLLQYIKNPYFKTNRNNNLISEYSIIIALDFLVFNKSNINIIQEATNNSKLLLDNLFNSNEKYIIDLNKLTNIIIYIDEYYMLVPYNNESKNLINNLDYEILYQKNNYIPERKINLNKLINEDLEINSYDKIKKYFIKKYENVNIENLVNIIYEFDFKFHIQFIEDIIDYFFNLYTNKNYQPNIYHDLFLKVLYFYNKFNIIIFANKLDNDLKEIYGKYIIPTNLGNFTISDDKDENYNYNNLINSLTQESESSSMNDDEKNKLYFSFYNKAVNETNNYILEKKKNLKIFDYLLPIGHLYDTKIKFYHPSKYWFNKLDYNLIKNSYKENNKIIGYLEKNNIGFDISFKLREPKSKDKPKSKDIRTIANGVNCVFKDKIDLFKICKLLNINLQNYDKKQLKKVKLCNLIKTELIKLELEERKKNSNIKYFYFYWEI